MANYTGNLGLEKPDVDDNVDVAVLNENYDLIDDAFGGRITGKRRVKSIDANANSCRIDVDTGLYLLMLSITGANNCWVGTVYCPSNGSVSASQINSLTGITVTTGSGFITANFTNTSSVSFHMVAIPLRNENIPQFH